MADNTKIEWCDATFNPWLGCTKVSAACNNCYAEVWGQRFGVTWGNHPRRRTSASYWRQPLSWNRKAVATGRPFRVFCASLADVFDNQVPIEWFADLLEVIRNTEALTWLLLTKRPQNIRKRLLEAVAALLADGRSAVAAWCSAWLAGEAPPNVSLGTTTEDQARADERIPHLLATPAGKRFLSCEPLLGPIDLTCVDIDGDSYLNAVRPDTPTDLWHDQWSPEATGMQLSDCIRDFTEEGFRYPPTDVPVNKRIDQVIVGGEGGPNARPMHPDWARSLRDQCQAAGVAYFFKQWGEWTPRENVERQTGAVQTVDWWDNRWTIGLADLARTDGHIDDESDLYRVGKKAAGRLQQLVGIGGAGYRWFRCIRITPTREKAKR